jgi:hypothetical protein
VGNRLVAAAGAVDMAGIMTAAAMVRGAPIGVVAGHVDHVFVDMILMRVVGVSTRANSQCGRCAARRGVRNPDRVGARGPDGWARSK